MGQDRKDGRVGYYGNFPTSYLHTLLPGNTQVLDELEMAILAAASRRGAIEPRIEDLKAPDKKEAPSTVELLDRIMPTELEPVLTLQLR